MICSSERHCLRSFAEFYWDDIQDCDESAVELWKNKAEIRKSRIILYFQRDCEIEWWGSMNMKRKDERKWL